MNSDVIKEQVKGWDNFAARMPTGRLRTLGRSNPVPYGWHSNILATRLLSVQKRSLVLVGLESSQPLESLWTADFVPVAVTFDLGRGWYYWADEQGSIYKTDGKKSNVVYSGELVYGLLGTSLIVVFIVNNLFVLLLVVEELCVDLKMPLVNNERSRDLIIVTNQDDAVVGLLLTGQPGITSLACDWLGGDLYWTNRKTESIYMGSANGRGFTTLLSKSISPSEMVVLPMER